MHTILWPAQGLLMKLIMLTTQFTSMLTIAKYCLLYTACLCNVVYEIV